MTKLNDSDRLKVAFVGGHVRRWHAADTTTEERVDSHTWGMLAIIHVLHPSPSVELLRAATFHDSPGELFSGDIPYGAKQAFPALGEADKAIGERAETALGVRQHLLPEEAWWLSFADMAQAVLFCRRQVGQGNSLMIPTLHDCEAALGSMIERPGAPEGVNGLVLAVLNCAVHLPLSRNLALLEELAGGE